MRISSSESHVLLHSSTEDVGGKARELEAAVVTVGEDGMDEAVGDGRMEARKVPRIPRQHEEETEEPIGIPTDDDLQAM